MKKAAIFDFDGTLCDTGIGVKKSAKFALDAFGIKSPEWEELDFFIGPPLLVTFQEKFEQSVTDAEKLVKKFRERYTNVGVYESEFYDGIAALLKTLKAQGVKLGIASSKPIIYVEELLKKSDLYNLFDYVAAVSLNADCESKQSIITRCLDELGVAPEDALMVGDRFYDVEGAKAVGAESAGVLWGFGSKFELIESGASFIVDKPQDIESIVLGLFERCENVETIFSGKVLNVHNDDILTCEGTKANRECVDHPGGAAVLCFNENDEVILVRQFRYPYRETIYEIPAGKLDKGEEPICAAARELKEECGATCDELVSLGRVYPSPGYTNEVIHLYYAKNPVFGEQNLDDDEFLQVCTMNFDTLVTKIMNDEITDAKTVMSVLKYKELRNKI